MLIHLSKIQIVTIKPVWMTLEGVVSRLQQLKYKNPNREQQRMKFQCKKQQVGLNDQYYQTIHLYFEKNKSKQNAPITHNLNSKVKPIYNYPPCMNPSTPSNNLYYEMEKNYRKMSHNLRKQQSNFLQACQSIRKATNTYYDQLIKIVNNSKQSTLNQVEEFIQKTIQKLQQHINTIDNAGQELKSEKCKKSIEQINRQFNQLSFVEIPVFRVENNPFKQFENLMKALKPSLILQSYLPTQQKQNIQQEVSCLNNFKQPHVVKMKKSNHTQHNSSYRQHQQEKESQNTTKKSSQQNYYSGNSNVYYAGNNYNTNFNSSKSSNTRTNKVVDNNMCDFSCEEEFEWNPDELNNHKYDKKQIVSEIIMEEPSSCEDSLMLSEVP